MNERPNKYSSRRRTTDCDAPSRTVEKGAEEDGAKEMKQMGRRPNGKEQVDGGG